MSANRRIHAYPGFGKLFRRPLAGAFPDREVVVWENEEQFARGLAEAEVLLALHPPRGHWARATRLRMIQIPGAGIDSLLPAPDLPAAVRIANARGVHEPEMSEFVLALILALAKGLPGAAAQQRAREWRIYASRPLVGQTAGILGLGAIGRGVARRCRELGMRVIGTRRNPAPLPEADAVYGPDETPKVLAEADVLVVLLPLTGETRGLLDAAALATLKPDALLVNVARGGIVDEGALAEALAAGQLAGAALDVFAEEPLRPESPLWDAANLLITPHAAGYNPDYVRRVGELFVENLQRLERGESLHNEVDRERGY